MQLVITRGSSVVELSAHFFQGMPEHVVFHVEYEGRIVQLPVSIRRMEHVDRNPANHAIFNITAWIEVGPNGDEGRAVFGGATNVLIHYNSAELRGVIEAEYGSTAPVEPMFTTPYNSHQRA